MPKLPTDIQHQGECLSLQTLFHKSFSAESGELPRLGTTGLELWFSNSFLCILFTGQGEIFSDQKEKKS